MMGNLILNVYGDRCKTDVVNKLIADIYIQYGQFAEMP